MASGKGAGKQYREKGEGYMYWFAFLCSICSLVLVFVAFASPFWYKSWSRVHSPLANVGMWHICLSGWVKPRDPAMRSYVGCWWIHSTFFEEVWDDIMPGKIVNYKGHLLLGAKPQVLLCMLFLFRKIQKQNIWFIYKQVIFIKLMYTWVYTCDVYMSLYMWCILNIHVLQKSCIT